MKKLIVLITLVMLSWSSYSQQDTTKVVLPTKTARLIYKDLLRYDGCKEEVKLLNDKIFKLNEKDSQKETIINLLTTKDKNNQFIMVKKDEQLKISEELTNSLHKELKSQRSKTFLWKVGTFVGIISTTYLILNNGVN